MKVVSDTVIVLLAQQFVGAGALCSSLRVYVCACVRACVLVLVEDNGAAWLCMCALPPASHLPPLAVSLHWLSLSYFFRVLPEAIQNLSDMAYRRPGFNCVVKQLRFWLFKVDCEFKDCDLRVLRIGHTCVIYTLRSNNCELREKSQFAIFKLRN